MNTLRVRIGDSYPHTLTLSENGTAIDLTAATVVLSVCDAATGYQAATIACTLSATPTDGAVTFTLPAVLSSSAGMYTITAGIQKAGGTIQWPTAGEQGLWVC